MSIYNDYGHRRLHEQRHHDLEAEARRAALQRQVGSAPTTRPDLGIATATSAETAHDQPSKTDTSKAHAVPQHWHVTTAEMADRYACDRQAHEPVRALTRGVTVDASVPMVYRWLCQLRIAPYSYDWIDNGGRRSPRTLSPGLDELAPGQSLIVATISEFEVDRHITGRATPQAQRLFGLVALTYQVSAVSSTQTRLVVRLLVEEPRTCWQQLRYHVLAWGDLVMMRKQLHTLKALAEEGERRRPMSRMPVQR